MPLDSGKSIFEIDEPDGGMVTRKPAHRILKSQSPLIQNADPSFHGGVKKRLGYIKFTSAAKSSPTGSFCSGLIAGTSSAAAVIKAWQFDDSSGTFVDETTDFNDSDTGDVDPFPATEAIGDYFAVGHRGPFVGLNVTISTLGVGGVVAWEYWNGSAWTALSGLVDSTSGFTASATSVRWTVPSDWATTSLNGSTLYYVRARITTTYGTNPVFTSGSIYGVGLILAAEGTTVQDISNGTWNTPISGLTITPDTPVDMLMFNDKFIILNQGGGPRYTRDGSTSTALGGSPPSNAQLGMIHRNRVFLAVGTSSVVTHSALLNEEDYTTVDDAGSLTFSKGDGMVVNGMCSGVDFAVISKISPSSGGKVGALFVLWGASPYDWNARKIADIGALSHRAMLRYDNFVVVATDRGIIGIQGRNPFKISEPVQVTYDEIGSKGGIALGRFKTKLYVAYPTSSANNRELVLDVERGVWAQNTGKTPNRYANHPDGRLLFGTSGSSILVWEAENGNNDDGSNIDFIWESPDMFFDDPWSPSRLDVAMIHAATTPSTTITATHYVDGTVTSFSGTMTTNTEGPVKKLAHFGANRGTFHRVRLRDNSTSGQTVIYGLKAQAKPFSPGVQRSA